MLDSFDGLIVEYFLIRMDSAQGRHKTQKNGKFRREEKMNRKKLGGGRGKQCRDPHSDI